MEKPLLARFFQYVVHEIFRTERAQRQPDSMGNHHSATYHPGGRVDVYHLAFQKTGVDP
jgi:hypothetical protein